MSTAQHTPGPWTTDEADHDAPHQEIKIKAGKNRTICTVWIDDAPVRDFNAEQEANARLIAAAPQLRAQRDALLALLLELVDIEGPQPGTSEWGDKVLAAIARVEEEAI